MELKQQYKFPPSPSCLPLADFQQRCKDQLTKMIWT